MSKYSVHAPSQGQVGHTRQEVQHWMDRNIGAGHYYFATNQHGLPTPPPKGFAGTLRIINDDKGLVTHIHEIVTD